MEARESSITAEDQRWSLVYISKRLLLKTLLLFRTERLNPTVLMWLILSVFPCNSSSNIWNCILSEKAFPWATWLSLLHHDHRVMSSRDAGFWDLFLVFFKSRLSDTVRLLRTVYSASHLFLSSTCQVYSNLLRTRCTFWLIALHCTLLMQKYHFMSLILSIFSYIQLKK